MARFVCFTHLIILSSALPPDGRQMSPVESTVTLSSNVNVPVELPNVLYSTPHADTSGLTYLHSNATKINGTNLESTDEHKVDDVNILHMPEESNLASHRLPGIHEVAYSGINKEFIEYILAGGTKGNDPFLRPIINEMQDMSQVGDSDRLTIINPTVIVNFRGTVLNRDRDVRLPQKKRDKGKAESEDAQ